MNNRIPRKDGTPTMVRGTNRLHNLPNQTDCDKSRIPPRDNRTYGTSSITELQ
jgi:hypothetical protein